MSRKKLKIPADFGVEEATFFAELEGLTPLMMHAPTSMMPASTATKRPGKTQQKPPAEEAELGAYRLPGGELYLPTPNLRGALVAAGKHFQDPAYKRGTLQEPLSAALQPADADDLGYVIIRRRKAVTDYTVDIRRVVNPTTKGAIMCARPLIPLPWSVSVAMGFDTGVIPAELLLKVVLLAGLKIGVGAFRPARKGPYGRFTCTGFEVEV